MKAADGQSILKAVRQHYRKAAAADGKQDCCSTGSSCCTPHPSMIKKESVSQIFSYTQKDLEALPESAFMGLGCGNPGAIASVGPGETVLDLGSGGGIDCYIAAKKTGPKGQVIGVDMTPEMLARARDNVLNHGIKNIDFRLGEIENLPVADNSIDVVISNCVINLSCDKPRVFAEAYRVLKPGGRLAIADMVASTPLNETVKKDLSLYVSCIAGAVFINDLKKIIKTAGFDKVSIQFKESQDARDCQSKRQSNSANVVKPAIIKAIKPNR